MTSASGLLDAIIKSLNEKMGEIVVSTFFRSARALALKDDTLVIAVPTILERDGLCERFTDNVCDILFEITGKNLRPEYLTEQEAMEWSKRNSTNAFAGYTFKNFIVGPCNRFAHAAANAVAEADFDLNTDRIYNPLFIYGPAGLGKTHLLYAIANRFKERYPYHSVLYIRSEDFLNEVVNAVRKNDYSFRNKYRNVDIFLVDDIQFFGNTDFVQEEFFNTFESLWKEKKHIVLTADRPPKEIASLTARIQSRCEMGLLVDVKTPDLETRIALVEEKSHLLGIVLDRKMCEYIASSITNNVRELEGAVHKIAAMHTLMGLKIDMDLVKSAISDIIKEKPGLHPTPELILDAVSNFYCISKDKLLSTSRVSEVAIARQIAFYLMREMTDMNNTEIGKFFEKDHTTVMHGIDKITNLMDVNRDVAGGVADLKKNIENM